MTLNKLLKLYKHYKMNYDFELTKRSYSEIEEKIAHEGEWLSDQEKQHGENKMPTMWVNINFC